MFGVRSEQDIDNSKEIKNSAHELYRRERARVAVDMTLTVKAGENCRLCVTDGEHTAMATGDMPQAAQRLALSADFAKEKLVPIINIEKDTFVTMGKTESQELLRLTRKHMEIFKELINKHYLK